MVGFVFCSCLDLVGGLLILFGFGVGLVNLLWVVLDLGLIVVCFICFAVCGCGFDLFVFGGVVRWFRF